MTVTLDLQALLASTAPQDGPARRALSSLSLAVAKSRRCVVITGAGISCSCGIPDFRSSDGLYNLVKSRYPDTVLKGRDLFDSSLFRDATSTRVFYTFMAELKAAIDQATPSPTHHFIKTLDTKGKLLRSYTQNIDGFEERIGLSTTSTPKTAGGPTKRKAMKNVQLHGNIHMVRCTLCNTQFDFAKDHLETFQSGDAPECPSCASRCQARIARSARAVAVGNLRPAIVLYDEHHPLGDEIGTIQTSDMSKQPDLLIIMGTSLKVHGLKRLVREFAGVVHEYGSSRAATAAKGKAPPNALGKVIFVNRTPPPGEWSSVIDYHVQADTDAWVQCVLEEWRKMRPADWEVQTTLDSPSAGLGELKASKPQLAITLPPKKKKKPKKATNHSSDTENIPLPSSSPPSSGHTLVEISASSSFARLASSSPPPISPTKRLSGDCHDHPDASPRKKRAQKGLSDASAEFKERGLLFGASPKKKGVKSEEDEVEQELCVKAAMKVGQKKTAGKRRVKKAVLADSSQIPP